MQHEDINHRTADHVQEKKKRQEDTVQSATGTQEKVLEKKGVRAATLSLLTQTFILD